MGKSAMFDYRKRLILPRFKPSNDKYNKFTISSQLNRVQGLFDIDDIYATALKNFRMNKDIANALDLLNICTILDKHPSEYTDAVNMLNRKCTHQVIALEDIRANNKLVDNMFENIRMLKKKIFDNPNNTYAWMDLAYCYTYLNQLGKANFCIEIAVGSKYANQVVLRNAARFYIHLQRNDDKNSCFDQILRLLHVVRKINQTQNDPYLMSLDISLSQFCDKPQANIKKAHRVIQDNNVSQQHMNELVGSLATYLNYQMGDNRRAKRLLRDYQQYFNENTHAQSNFMFPFDDWDGSNINNDFEYQTRVSLALEKYQDAYNNAISWSKYQPFSSRPIILATFISSSILLEYQKTIDLIDKFIKFKDIRIIRIQDEPMIFNNYAFALLKMDQSQEAKKILDEINNLGLDSNSKAVINATTGLYNYRINKPLEAEKLYNSTIQHFSKNGDQKSKYLAILMKLSEESRLNKLLIPDETVRSIKEKLDQMKDKVLLKIFERNNLDKYL